MTDRHSLIAFSILIFAICYLATVAAVLAWNQRYAEALGFGGLTTGLVGVLGTFKPKSRDTAASTQTGDVNVTKEPTQ